MRGDGDADDRGDGGGANGEIVTRETSTDSRAHASIGALNPNARAIDAAIDAQEDTIEHLVRACESLRGVLGDGGETDGAEEDFIAARAATRVARDIAREMAEATATLARVKRKLIDAGVVRARDLTPFVPE